MKIHKAIAMLLLTTVAGGGDRSGMAPSIARDRYQLVGMAGREALRKGRLDRLGTYRQSPCCCPMRDEERSERPPTDHLFDDVTPPVLLRGIGHRGALDSRV